MDAVILARLQFAANISFHILFPSITIALAWVLLYFKLRHDGLQETKPGDMRWMAAYRFWVKVFALSFAMGVVSGITMSFQFGTNWPGYMQTVGNVAGPLLAYEVLTAFFLEAVFLGIMLFGFKRVPNWVHTTATFLVAFGTTLSAFWILALNSWMQTPAGHTIRDGIVHAEDWVAIIFNPSFPYRLVHMLLASGLTAAFLVAGVSALRWYWGDRAADLKAALKTGIYLAAILIPLQILAGDMHGLNTLEYQPQKVAAMEGNWQTQSRTPLLLFAWPDEAQRENRFEIGIPSGASLILRHSPDGVVPGLNDYAGNHPPVAPLFFAFRIMVGLGLLMLVVAWAGSFYLWRRGELPLLLQRTFIGMTFSGWVAVLSGWYVTEIGRQPYLVTGILRTEDAVSPVPAPMIGLSLSLYLIVYAFLIVAYMGVITRLAWKAAKGDKPQADKPAEAGTFAAAE
ncbi:cytochrome ubiquinol oxidase subunit I [Dongia sp.]|uniref:cytochrome ubiquinol oxidase subunit I n=1 Tax=Dongia sp. TaxID=1977262 RepID=UPI0035B231B3